jgi:PEGA domain-containing protein
MMRQKLSIGLVAAAFSVSLSPVWAQERERPQQSEPSRPSSGDTVGSAVPRGGDGGSSSSSPSSGSGGSATSSSGSPSSSGSSTGWMGGNSSSYESPRAPMHPDRASRAEAAEQRRSGGTSTGRAVPRGESGGRSAGSAGSTNATSGSESQPSSEGRNRAVPTYSRPRDGRNPVGTAVERTTPLPDGNNHNVYYPGVIYNPGYSYYYDPYYSNRYSYWSPYGYGYGLGYFSYDPFLFSGMGYPGYYGGGAYDPYYGGGGYSSGYSQSYRDVGSLRLKVKPSNAQVYIDGYYVGVIDSFDGVLQRLRVEAGTHRVELRAEGYEPVQFEVMITPGDTITYKGEMTRR